MMNLKKMMITGQAGGSNMDKNIGHKAVQDALKNRFLSSLDINYLANPETEYTFEAEGEGEDSYGE
jgi:hypothetical protein